MDVFSVMLLLGGLGIFLYGLSVMGTSLEHFAGGKLERILEKCTNNTVKGITFGAAVTAFVQSSSATTVMVVGFVNSGIMQFERAIGVIMGSNIGTTITAWILSLAGLESSNFFVQLAKPKNFSLIFAIVGVILYLFVKSSKKKNLGLVLLGFTILIYGMEFMSDAMSPLRDDPNFQNLFTMFENPILGVLIGAAVTALIQSSSASVGILQALVVTGAVTYASAIPIILGQNIGTCITAMLSSIGAKRDAKRVAFVHLYFNVIGTAIFLALIYIYQGVVGFPFWSMSVNAMDIAVVHTTFNVFATLMFLPFTKYLAKLATLTVKDKDSLGAADTEPAVTLDRRFLNSPPFALERCKETLANLCKLTERSVEMAQNAVSDFNTQLPDDIKSNVVSCNHIADKLNSFIVELSTNKLSKRESRYIGKLLHSIRGLVRINDISETMVVTALKAHENKVSISQEAQGQLDVLMDALNRLVKEALISCATDDVTRAESHLALTDVVGNLCVNYREEHIMRLMDGVCTIDGGLHFDEQLHLAEQIVRRATALLIQTVAVTKEEYRSQDFIEDRGFEKTELFKEKYNDFKSLYYSMSI